MLLIIKSQITNKPYAIARCGKHCATLCSCRALFVSNLILDCLKQAVNEDNSLLIAVLLNKYLLLFTASNHVGFGLMDAYSLVSYAKNWTTVPSQLNCTISHPQINRCVVTYGVQVRPDSLSSTKFHLRSQSVN